jgi:hypothetical protein
MGAIAMRFLTSIVPILMGLKSLAKAAIWLLLW